MKRDGEHRASWWKRATKAGIAAMVAGVAVGSAGCLSRPINPLEPTTTTTEVETLHQSKVDKIDLLLMIDNSASMADKQSILGDAVSNLVTGLLNPKCLKIDDPTVEGTLPASPTDDCAMGYQREFNAVFDVHIGIVTSSLGSHGSDQCDPSAPDTSPSVNDAGHLIHRDVSGGNIATYQGNGFLAWDPKMALTPPGISVLSGPNSLSSTLTEMVTGAGQDGCGYEASIEAWYRFLVDPVPYTAIAFDGGTVKQSGKDETLLQQRADFMRPDSLLAIIMLSDENDCSIKEYSYFPLVAKTDEGNYHLPVPTKQCATDPTSSCCSSCGILSTSDACYADSGCTVVNGQKGPSLSAANDPINLRCYQTKRRFGVDFLYPIERYTLALSEARIPDPHQGDGTNTSGPLVENPIFTDLNKTGAAVRDKTLVFVAGIVGVPWQDIAVDPNDLTKGFKDDTGMNATTIKVNGQNRSTWDVILGDPDAYKDPLDPHMIETQKPRTGTDPITGTALAGVNAAPGTDKINGHEWDTGENPNGDLEYACIFDLPTPKDCTTAGASCDCPDGTDPEVTSTTNPLCDTTTITEQVRAKGYPGLRELQVLKSVGPQGIVGSICPATLDQTHQGKVDYGYNAAVQGIINRLKAKLGGACLAETFHPFTTGAEKGQVPCVIIEASKPADCNAQCALPGHSKVPTANEAAVPQIKALDTESGLDYDCFCALDQASGDDLTQCLSTPDTAAPDLNVWCYVDAEVESVNEALVKDCPDGRKRRVRFLGGTNEQSGTVYVTCSE